MGTSVAPCQAAACQRPQTEREIAVPLTFKEVSEILKLIDASQCDEVVLELEGTRLVVRRNAGGIVSPPPNPAPSAASSPSLPSAAASPASTIAGAAAETSAQEGMKDVRSPMVGTFYRCPSPEEPPFVEAGVSVKKGDTLCLIEVMKLFTAVEAPADGILESILPDDGASVEFNQLLFRIRA